MHDVMHAIVVYMTHSECVAHCNCASGVLNAYVCMSDTQSSSVAP